MPGSDKNDAVPLRLPEPGERKDADRYDHMDCRPLNRETGIKTPPWLQALIDERRRHEETPDGSD